MVNHMMCQFCNDVRRYRMSVDDARRIRINLSRITGEERIEAKLSGPYDIAHFNEHKPLHFMCGQCTKVNRQELINEEKLIAQYIINFLCIAEKNYKKDSAKFNSQYVQILSNLSGNYPKIARNLEQYWFKYINVKVRD